MRRIRVFIISFLFFGVIFILSIGIFGVSTFSARMEVPERKQMNRPRDISNQMLDERKFSCSGSCYCKENEDSRRISSVSSFKTLLIPITAFSLGMAFKYASNDLDSECFNLYSKECEDSISSFVEFCEEGGESDDAGVKIPEKYKNNYEEEYECIGYCLKNGKQLKERARPEGREICENYDCESLTTKGIVRVKIPKTGGKYLRKWNNELKKREYSSDEGTPNLNSAARGQFLKEYLTSYCKMNSKETYFYVYHCPNGNTEYKSNTASMCGSVHNILDGVRNKKKYYQFENIQCKKIRKIWGVSD